MIEVAVSVVSIEALITPESEVLAEVNLLLSSDLSVEMVIVALVVVESSIVVTSAKVELKLLGEVEVSESNSESEIAVGSTEAV